MMSERLFPVCATNEIDRLRAEVASLKEQNALLTVQVQELQKQLDYACNILWTTQGAAISAQEPKESTKEEIK